MDDLSLRNRILTTLQRLPLIAASEIGVGVHEGVVILTGVVPDEGHKALIERAVLNLADVRALAQKIHVSADADYLDSDEEIATRLVRMIDWNISKSGSDIRVRVENRRVTLTGQVGCREDLDKVQHFASGLWGCAGLSNQLVVSVEKKDEMSALADAAA